jgi:glyoxylase-like metal-dependent hydrolase (beta-lactamase superfamily II)
MITFKLPELTCERYVLGPMEVNTYLIYDNSDSSQGVLVDPAEESQTLLDRIIELNLTDVLIFLTHGHADHLYGVDFFRKQLKAKVAISEFDAPMLTNPDMNLSSFIGEQITLEPADQLLENNAEIKAGKVILKAVCVPGHTPGGMILVGNNVVISGDTLFAGSIGRSDFPGGNGPLLIKSIENAFFSLSNRLVLPGHGPETEIDEEKTNNPFFAAKFTV